MSATTSFFNPSLIDVWRRVRGDTPGPTGNPQYTPTKLYSQIPAFVDHATRGVSDKLEFSLPGGEMVEQTDICFIDGLVPQQFAGSDPGDTVTVDGISYLVDEDGNGAFVDVKPFDVIVHGTDCYLVLQATKYPDVEPSLQLHLNFGRAWELPPPPPETNEVFNGNIDFTIGTGSFETENGGATTVGPCTGSTVELADEATFLNNGGIFKMLGSFPTLEGTNAGSSCTINPGGEIDIGLGGDDDPTLSYGISAVGVISVSGLLRLLNNASVIVGGSANGSLIIAAGGALKTSPTSNCDLQVSGTYTVSDEIDIPDDNQIATPNGAVLAMFTHAQGSGHAVAFTDASVVDGSQGDVVSWAWDFGDSGTSTAQNPTHTFAAAGTYDVTLTVTTSGGKTSTCTVNPLTVT